MKSFERIIIYTKAHRLAGQAFKTVSGGRCSFILYYIFSYSFLICSLLSLLLPPIILPPIPSLQVICLRADGHFPDFHKSPNWYLRECTSLEGTYIKPHLVSFYPHLIGTNPYLTYITLLAPLRLHNHNRRIRFFPQHHRRDQSEKPIHFAEIFLLFSGSGNVESTSVGSSIRPLHKISTGEIWGICAVEFVFDL